MRDGFKIYDSDAHISPMAEILDVLRWGYTQAPAKVPFRVGWAGEILQPPYRHRYQLKKSRLA